MSSEGHSGSLSERAGAFQHDPLAAELEAELGVVVQSTPNSQIQSSTPPLRLKIPGGSLGKMFESSSSRELPRPPRSRSESPIPPRTASPSWSRSGSPSLVHRGSPLFPPSGSPAFAAPSQVAAPPPFSLGLESVPNIGSLGSRGSIGSLSRRSPRIDREDIHKRLLLKRNTDSPVPEEPDEISTANRSTGGDATDASVELGYVSSTPPRPPPLHRDGTYDGVMSIDPNPQPSDPPRPSLVVRAQSELEAGGTHSAGTTGFQTRIRHVSPGLDLGINAPGTTRVEIDEVRSALERLVQDVVTDSANASMSARASPQGFSAKGSRTSLDIAAVTKRIMYDPPGDYDTTMEEDEKLDDRESRHLTPDESTTPSSAQRTPELLSGGGFMSPSLSRNTSESSNPLQPVQKDAIRAREQIILEKRREMRRREQDEDMGYVTPPRNPPSASSGRPSARRSMSTGDAEDMQAVVRLAALNPSGSSVLPEVVATEEKDPLAESIARELRKLRGSTKGVSLVFSCDDNLLSNSFSRDIMFGNIVRLFMLRQTQIRSRISMGLAISTAEEPGGQFVAHPTWYENIVFGGQRLTSHRAE